MILVIVNEYIILNLRRSPNNMGYRIHEFNNDKIPNQLGDDSVVYNEITDETASFFFKKAYIIVFFCLLIFFISA